MPQKITFVLGTRPEIIKLSPLMQLCDDEDIPYSIVHTGQHYSESLDDVFFDQLRLPSPDYNLEVGSDSHGAQTGEMLKQIELVFKQEDPDIVLLQGDTNSVLAGAMATSKMPDIKFGHVEAGLRSYNWDMPEEINRRVADHVADYLFAPTTTARNKLLAEDIPEDRISVTGNTIADAVQRHVRIAHEESDILQDLVHEESFALMTAHRAENVDDFTRFQSILDGASEVAQSHEIQIIYPTHPRAQKRIDEFDIEVPPEIQLIEPLDFLDFLVLEDEAEIVFTDSGGVQEETCILQTPCVTLRDETERPETIEVGSNQVVGVEPESIIRGANKMLERRPDWENPFGDGHAAERILKDLGLLEQNTKIGKSSTQLSSE